MECSSVTVDRVKEVFEEEMGLMGLMVKKKIKPAHAKKSRVVSVALYDNIFSTASQLLSGICDTVILRVFIFCGRI
jgi:hypothetical protein